MKHNNLTSDAAPTTDAAPGADDGTELVLVTGGTGKTGRRVADRLQQAQVPVRIGSRAGTPPFDWNDRSTWGPALHGATAVYVAYVPDLAFPGADDVIGDFARTAADSGARRLVLLSGRGEPGAASAEQALQSAAPSWTVVRCSWFDQNFSEDFFLDSVLAGTLAVPAGDVAEPFIDADDIADIAVAALRGTIPAGAVHELTGPRSMTFGEAAEQLSIATGRRIEYVPVSNAQFRSLAIEHGMPADLADGLGELMATVLDGRNTHTTDTVERLLGRPATDFATFAERTAATGVWDVADRVGVSS